ncbi:MAG: ATP-binding protein [Pseudomonadota bacterium]
MCWMKYRGSFLRFYLLLGLTLLAIFLIAMIGRIVIERVGHDDYREQLAHFPMAVLMAELAPLSVAEREQRLPALSQRLGSAVELDLVPVADASLNFFEQQRLDRGAMLVETSPWRLRQRLGNAPWLLSLTLEGWKEQHWQATVALAAEGLAGLGVERRAARLEELASTRWNLELINQLPEELTAQQHHALANRQVVTRLAGERLDITLLTPLSGTSPLSPLWLEAELIVYDDPLPLHLYLMLLLSVMMILTLVIYLIMRNIESRMVRLELAATRIANGRLETRVKVQKGDFLGRLGMAFNVMASQVQTLLRGQQEMIRAVSHELRTPVARIRFAVQMVEDMTDKPVIQRQLQGIDADISELDKLIDEILTYARLDGDAVNATEMETSLVDCRAMVERVLDTLTPLHDDMTLALLPGMETELLAEPRYLQRALQNLVSNACRHGRSRVEVRVWNESHLVRIDVEDDGPGVPHDSRKEIFKPFTRLDDSRARSSGGYGLGLSIVQKIIIRHGGSITTDTSPNLGGARFTLLLPRRDSLA